MTRRVNAAGLSLITSFEGYEPKWYRDAVGVWTIGYGHTDSAGPPKYANTRNLVLSKADATELLADDLGQYAAAVEKAVKVPLNDNQFAALVSFCYNVGAGNLAKSTLVKKLNAGDYKSVRSELAKWNKAKGKVLKGLTRRRAAEADLFEAKSVIQPPAPKPVPLPPADDPVVSVPAAPKEEKRGLWAVIGALLMALFGRKT